MKNKKISVELLKILAFDAEETVANGCGEDCSFNGVVRKLRKKQIIRNI